MEKEDLKTHPGYKWAYRRGLIFGTIVFVFSLIVMSIAVGIMEYAIDSWEGKQWIQMLPLISLLVFFYLFQGLADKYAAWELRKKK